MYSMCVENRDGTEKWKRKELGRGEKGRVRRKGKREKMQCLPKKGKKGGRRRWKREERMKYASEERSIRGL